MPSQEEARVRLPTGGRAKAAARSYLKWKRQNPQAYKKHAKQTARWKKSHKSRVKKMARTARPGYRRMASSHETLSNLMDHIERLALEVAPDDEQFEHSAMAMFANLALISEMLTSVFESALEEGVGADTLPGKIEDFEAMAHETAQIVEFLDDFLDEHDAEDLDPEPMKEAMQDFLQRLAEGLKVFNQLREAIEESFEGKKGESAA